MKKKKKGKEMTVDPKKLQYQYAWDWFQYHARQRLLAFNFFIIIISALGYAYFNFSCNDEIIIIPFIGVFISLAFLSIELRNKILVEDGRKALDQIPLLYSIKIRNRDLKRFSEENKARCLKNRLISHTFWLRAIYILSLTLFISTIIYEFNNFELYGKGKVFACVFLIVIFFYITIHNLYENELK